MCEACISHLLWNIHWCVHRHLPLNAILSKMNPSSSSHPTHLVSTLISSLFLHTHFLCGIFHSHFPTKIFKLSNFQFKIHKSKVPRKLFDCNSDGFITCITGCFVTYTSCNIIMVDKGYMWWVCTILIVKQKMHWLLQKRNN